jgi:hypothetical protein
MFNRDQKNALVIAALAIIFGAILGLAGCDVEGVGLGVESGVGGLPSVAGGPSRGSAVQGGNIGAGGVVVTGGQVATGGSVVGGATGTGGNVGTGGVLGTGGGGDVGGTTGTGGSSATCPAGETCGVAAPTLQQGENPCIPFYMNPLCGGAYYENQTSWCGWDPTTNLCYTTTWCEPSVPATGTTTKRPASAVCPAGAQTYTFKPGTLQIWGESIAGSMHTGGAGSFSGYQCVPNPYTFTGNC